MLNYLALIIFIIINTANAQDTAIKMAQLTSWEGKHEQAIEEYDKILKRYPNNPEALDGKAEVLSWMGKFKESIEAYNQRLAINYDAKAARQKARVLGWWQHYNDSIDAYQEAYEKTKVEGIRLEMLAKESWWNNRTLYAVNYYEELLKIEPDNLEARSDAAQVEGMDGWVDESKNNFEYITQKHQWHFRAADGLEKINRAYNDVSINANLSWFNALSPDRFTEIRMFSSDLIFEIPFLKNYSFLLGYNLENFNYINSSSIIRHYGVAGFKATLNGQLWLEAMYGATAYTSNKTFSQKYNINIKYKPVEPIILSVFSNREDLINNKTVITDKIHSTQLGSDIRINWHRVTSSIIEYKRGFLNDKNSVNYAAYEQIFSFLFAPTELTLTGRFQFEDWKTSTVEYFSPQNFWYIPITLRWRHFLNKDGLYYGARDTYYGLRYKFQVDRSKIIFNGLGAEFHHDFSKKIGIHFDIFGDYSNVYKDFGTSIGVVGYF